MVAGPASADHWFMPTRSRSLPDLAVPAASLATAVVLACLFPLWALLRGLYLSFYLQPTDTALYAARVGHNLAAGGAIAALVLIAVAVGIRWIAPAPGTTLTAGVAVTLGLVLGLTGLNWVAADRALHPYGPERRAVASFVPPPGATVRSEGRTASDHPAVRRYWSVPGSVASVCPVAVERLTAWADPGTVVKKFPLQKGSCSYDARRGRHAVELSVSEPGPDEDGVAVVGLHVRRA